MAAETDQPTPDAEASPTRSRRVPAFGVLLAGVLVLSACGGSPEGDGQAGSEEPSESASSSASPSESASEGGDGDSGGESASASESADGAGEDGADDDGSDEPVPASSEGPAQNWPEPERPEEISEKTQEGAEEALKYWWELDAYSRNTGDTLPQEQMSMSTCTYCKERLQLTLTAYDQGGWWHQEEHDITEIALVLQDDGSYKGYFTMDSGAFTSYPGDASANPNEGTPNQLWGAKFTYAEGRWVAEDLSHQCNGNKDEECSTS